MNSRIFKRIGVVLLFAAVILGITGIPVRADEYVTVQQIQDAVNSQISTYIVLTDDVFADSMLIIPRDKDVTLKLNGHSLMRDLESASEDGSIIYVEEGGKLTIDDVEGEGTISGGYAVNGGGIYNAGTLVIEGGMICDNKASGNGGGIYNTGTLELKDSGQVSINYAGHDGGGIYSTGTVEIEGGFIYNNEAAYSAGGLYICGGTVTITEGGIVANTALNYHGGGIYVAESGMFNLYGGSITENTAAGQGGGILVHAAAGTVSVKSKPVVTGNTAAKGNNIYLRDGKVLNVAGELEDGAALGVLLSSGLGTITANYSDYNGEGQLNAFQNDYYYSSLVLKDGEVTVDTLSYLIRTWENDQIKETREKVPAEGVNNGLPDGTLSEGWYIVGGTVTKTDRITISGTVNLILADGCVLNAPKGIVVPSGSTLKIWTQSDDSGKIIATGADEAAGIGGANESSYGDIEIYGGTITATGATYGAGIGGGDQSPITGHVFIYGGTVTATGGEGGAGIGSGDDGYGTGKIIIYGGDVTAYGNNGGAGIGGGWHSHQGEAIEIHGGKVKATANSGGAGIGGGFDRNGDTITITGGEVTAEGKGDYGVGIGGDEQCGTITISGGTVTAIGDQDDNGYKGGAGIGSAAGSDMKGSITISGGTVTANGGKFSAGIGSAYYLYEGYKDGGDVTGTITISGGTVYAYGGNMSAGIGAGFGGNNEGTITISGGYVEAYGATSKTDTNTEHDDTIQSRTAGAGIGGGGIFRTQTGTSEGVSYYSFGGCGGTINITGGEVIAKPGIPPSAEEGHYPSAIGHGCGTNATRSDGTLTLSTTMEVITDHRVYAGERENACRSFGTVHIRPCEHDDSASVDKEDIDGTYHKLKGACPYCGLDFEKTEEHSFDADTHTCVCGHKEYKVTASVLDDEADARIVFNEDDTGSVQYVSSGSDFYLIVETEAPKCDIYSAEYTGDIEDKTAVWETVSDSDGKYVFKFPDMRASDLDIVVKLTQVVNPVFSSFSLILSDRIGITFYLQLPEEKKGTDYPGAYVTFSGNKIDGSTKYYLTDDNKVNDHKYKFTVMLSSIQMAEKITPVFEYDSSDSPLQIYGDAHSVQDYIEDAIAAEESGNSLLTSAQMEIVKALADYGYYAQQYLSAQNGWTIGEDYAEMMTSSVNTYTDADYEAVAEATRDCVMSYTQGSEVVTKVNFRVVFGSSVGLDVLLTPSDGREITSVTVDGDDTATVKSGKRYMVSVSDIYASDLTKSHKIIAGDCTINVSSMSYVHALLEKEGATKAVKDLMTAFYRYAKACSG